MTDNQYKYEADVHAKSSSIHGEWVYIGTVYANSLLDLKETARELASSRNKHLFGRLFLDVYSKNDFRKKIFINL